MKNVQDLCPLTPMQRAMLLRALAATGPDTLFNQFCYEIRGPVDAAALQAAWQAVVDRHDSLRAAFLWEDLRTPLQIVRQHAVLPFESVTLGVPSDAAASALAGFLARDRERGFDLASAPLMRTALLRCSDDVAYLVWSSHHLILDRWCVPVLLSDFDRMYSAHRTGGALELPPASSFRDYVRWLQRQDESRANAFWRAETHGIAASARTVIPPEAARDPLMPGAAAIRLPAAESRAVRSFARALGVTPNTVVQGGWALVLNQRSERQDVVFGATVAGRPPEVPGVEQIVGSLISNVPVRVAIPETSTVGDWLRSMHRRQQERAAFEYLAAADIHELSGLPAAEPLFDSLLVWLAPIAGPGAGASLALRALPGSVATPFPVTLVVSDVEDGGIELALHAADSAAGSLDLAATLEVLRASIDAITRTANRPLAGLPGFRRESAPVLPDHRNGAALPAATGRRESAPGGREEDELAMVQQALLTECRGILRRESIGLADNFFESGGTSLRAALLHARIERIMGREVPMLSLFQVPDLDSMARFLTQRQWPVRAEIVRPVQPHGTATPLLCVSSPDVNSIGYVLLARHLAPEQPVYLVQSPPATDDVLRIAITQIPELAERYVDGVREVLPHGPYRLLGMCDGALLAVEMARLLREAGDTVEFVGSLNTFSLNTLSPLFHVKRVEARLRYYARRFGAWRRESWQQKRADLRRVLHRRLASLRSAFRPAPTPDARPDPAQIPEAAAPSVDAVAKEWLELDWPDGIPQSPKYPGTLTLFRIRRQPYYRIRDPFLGWRKHVDELAVVHLRTKQHLDILREPHVQETAAAVTACLERLTGAVHA